MRGSGGPSLLSTAWHRLLLEATALPGPLGESMQRKYLRATKPRALDAFEDAIGALNPDDIVLDLGANVGRFTGRFAATGAVVHAFEPDPSLAEHLQQRFASASNVVVHAAAVAASSGRQRLYFARKYDPVTFYDSASSTLVPASRERHSGGSVEVDVVDLVAFIGSLPRRPALIKMDIEGAEWPILERMLGASDPPFRYLFAELHDKADPRRLRPLARSLRRRAAALRGGASANLSWR